MRSSALRHLVPLRLTLAGTHPEIWREVVVDHDLSLDDLRRIAQSVFPVALDIDAAQQTCIDSPDEAPSRASGVLQSL
jgi:hypothetical protein